MRLRNTFISLLVGLVLAACTDEGTSELGFYAYPRAAAVACDPNTKSGVAGATDRQQTSKGIRYNVRTPANYDPRVAHPLLVVFAPADLSATANERLTGLTKMATAAGFVIAYAGHVRNSIPVIEDLSMIPALIAKTWCIDVARLYLTGHSDGGTVALAIAVMEKTRSIPRAIAPSAAGFTKKDLAEFKCRAPLSVLTLHSARDTLFPGFGADAATWWAACNRCDADPQSLANGCVSYANCAGR
jgi:polyhydroxybutyrate depolymerase